MKIVISLGGSVFSLNDHKYIVKFIELIKKASKDFDIYVIIGGGKTSRTYIHLARKLCENERYLDTIGITATHLNALLFNSVFQKHIPKSIEEALEIQPPVIMGGTLPGHSTDAVAAMLAEKLNATLLIIATDVDGVFNKDPKKHDDAIKLDRISIGDLQKIVGNKWKKAGESAVIDAVACNIIKKKRMKTYVINGKKLKELDKRRRKSKKIHRK